MTDVPGKRSSTRTMLTVEEHFDQAGDLVWTIGMQTHSRRAIDTLAQVLDADVQWPIRADAIEEAHDLQTELREKLGGRGPTSAELRRRVLEAEAGRPA